MPGGSQTRRSTRFVYSGIRVADLERSLEFYRTLGFREVKRGSFAHGGRYVHLSLAGSPHRIELNFYPKGTRFYEKARTGAAFDHFGFYDPDPGAWSARMISAGAKLKLDYVDGDQRLVFVTDPDGVWLGVYGPAEPSPVVDALDSRHPDPAARFLPGWELGSFGRPRPRKAVARKDVAPAFPSTRPPGRGGNREVGRPGPDRARTTNVPT
ncbi:MAG: VOC family protein, partial [Thermoplasmata archaeon]|nr:VOC family protein [Thermoplasmata archaeon]